MKMKTKTKARKYKKQDYLNSLQANGLIPHEIIVDNFAGGGGTSTGMEAAFGRPVDIAINHDPEAISMHRVNHPKTVHLCESVWDIDPLEATKGQPVGLVWLSPDCKHFSRAKGGVPVNKRIRGLAWVAHRWAAVCRPRVIMLENVAEFQDWGPLGADGKPCEVRKGKTFKSFVRKLERKGYKVEYRELKACDYGTPTIRNRFFLIARRDGIPISWPKPTHGEPGSKDVLSGKLKPWRSAAECIDWSLPSPSIFESSKEIKEKYGLRANRPLKTNTCNRIAAGMMRYVVDNPTPFIVKANHTASYYNCFRGQSLNEPLQTVTQAPGFGVVTSFISKFRNTNIGHDLEEPLHTVTASGNHFGLLTPVLTECANASSPRCMPIQEPLRTICASTKGGHHAIITPFIAKHYTGVVGSEITEPLHTVTAVDHNSVISPYLIKDTVDTSANTLRIDHSEAVSAFLAVYYGNEKDGQSLDDPMRTVTSKQRFGLVTIKGVNYRIVDIGFRMLQPRELFRAQGFKDSYIIDYGIDEHGKKVKLTKKAQTKMVGNSVCPDLSEALIKANFKHELEYLAAV